MIVASVKCIAINVCMYVSNTACHSLFSHIHHLIHTLFGWLFCLQWMLALLFVLVVFCEMPFVCVSSSQCSIVWSNVWFLWSLPCSEWQNFFVLLQSSFSDKLNIENDGSPVVSFTMFKNFGKQFSSLSPSSDEYVSRSIRPLHLVTGK